MHKLIVNPDTDAQWEIPLRPGSNILGSGEENESPITHPSLAAAHCEVIPRDHDVLVRDYATGLGTFVNGEPITDFFLQPGHTLRLGEVEFRLEISATPAFTPQPVLTENSCRHHPQKKDYLYACPKCRHTFCDQCLTARMVLGETKRFCRICHAECESLGEAPETIAANKRAAQFRHAFTYPFQTDGLFILIGGTLFFLLMDFVNHFAGLIGLGLSVATTGYLIAYLQRIVNDSADGRAQMPDWPDFSNFTELCEPFGQFLVTFLISFGPAIGFYLFALKTSWFLWAFFGSLAFGVIYFPMAWLAVTLFDSIGGVSPHVVLPSMLRIPGHYLLAVALMAGIFIAETAIEIALDKFLPIPLLPSLIVKFLGLYLLIVEMRVLGLLYWRCKSHLGWFSR